MMPHMTPPTLPVNEDEMSFSFVRAQGAGGQNVNKVSSAVHLRYDIHASSLPNEVKTRLLALRDQRITDEGVVVIKAQTQRSQEQNRAAAIARLQALVDSVAVPPTPRKPTRPTRASQRRRLQGKAERSEVKQQRGRVSGSE
jgi:ribosome-associated protein